MIGTQLAPTSKMGIAHVSHSSRWRVDSRGQFELHRNQRDLIKLQIWIDELLPISSRRLAMRECLGIKLLVWPRQTPATYY